MSSRDRPNLLAILDAISRIGRYTRTIASADEYYEASVVFDATLMNFVVIGEMVDRLSTELKEKHADIDWQKIKGFRNLIAHDYLGIDAEEVWQIIQTDLPALEQQLEALERELHS
jgi:uncharacterized protein with HEPN domain